MFPNVHLSASWHRAIDISQFTFHKMTFAIFSSSQSVTKQFCRLGSGWFWVVLVSLGWFTFHASFLQPVESWLECIFYVCRLSHDSLVVTPWEFMSFENNCTMTGFTAVCIPWRNASSKECFLEAMQKHRVLCCSWKSHGKAGSNLAHLQAVGIIMYSRFMITLTFSVWYQYSKLLVTMQVIP